jgi:hypothetical protein
MKTLAIYTVLTGDKEPLGNAIRRLQSIETDLKIDFICFTDNPDLKSNVWQCRVFDTHCLPPEKSSRRPKALPHEYLADYDYSLYMDNICELKRLPNQTDLVKSFETDYVYRVFKHSTRIVLAEEALAISSLGYDTAENLINQLDTYAQYLPLQTITPLNTCTVLLRQHNHLPVIRHGRMWWEHILNFSKRDQMSFDFCRIVTGLRLNWFEGTKFDNELICPHNNSSDNRVLASFDEREFRRLKNNLSRQRNNKLLTPEELRELKLRAHRTPSTKKLLAYLAESGLYDAAYL